LHKKHYDRKLKRTAVFPQFFTQSSQDLEPQSSSHFSSATA
jgi:hypothetical protein